jgi:hypothetical protein
MHPQSFLWCNPASQAVNGGNATYLGSEIPFDLTTIAGVEVVGMAIAEGRRAEADWNGACVSHELTFILHGVAW